MELCTGGGGKERESGGTNGAAVIFDGNVECGQGRSPPRWCWRLSGADLQPTHIQALCLTNVGGYDEEEPLLHVTLTPEARAAVVAGHELSLAVAARRAVYGRSTGVGANRTIDVDARERAQHGARLLRSHAHDSGERLPRAVVRAAMLVRANQLAIGAAGLRPDIVDALVQALNDRRAARVSRLGGIGTGDLALLAEVALALQGEQPWDDGTVHSYLEEPFGPDDALPFMSSNAPSIALASLAAGRLSATVDAALAVAALSFVALRGNLEAYAESVHRHRPHPGQVKIASRLRHLLEGAVPAARLQDPYGLRCLPQVHGPVLEVLERLDSVLCVELNAGAENPLIADGDAFHNGNFHQMNLATTLDQVRLCAAQVGMLALTRITKLHDPAFTDQRAFLAAGAAGSSGTMMLEYTAASALADVRLQAQPVTLQSVVLSLGMEDHAAWVWHAAEQAERLDRSLRQLLACELVAALRSLRLSNQGPHRIIPVGLASIAEAAMSSVPHIDEDHRMTDVLTAAEAALAKLANIIKPMS